MQNSQGVCGCVVYKTVTYFFSFTWIKISFKKHPIYCSFTHMQSATIRIQIQSWASLRKLKVSLLCSLRGFANVTIDFASFLIQKGLNKYNFVRRMCLYSKPFSVLYWLYLDINLLCFLVTISEHSKIVLPPWKWHCPFFLYHFHRFYQTNRLCPTSTVPDQG